MNPWGIDRDRRIRLSNRRVASRRWWIALGGMLAYGAAPAADSPDVYPQLGHSNVVHAVTFSPNGTSVASAGEDGAAKLWDIATQRELRTLKVDANGVNSAAFSPDGATLATGGRDGTVVLWDVVSGHQLHVLKGHAAPINSIAFSPTISSKRSTPMFATMC